MDVMRALGSMLEPRTAHWKTGERDWFHFKFSQENSELSAGWVWAKVHLLHLLVPFDPIWQIRGDAGSAPDTLLAALCGFTRETLSAPLAYGWHAQGLQQQRYHQRTP